MLPPSTWAPCWLRDHCVSLWLEEAEAPAQTSLSSHMHSWADSQLQGTAGEVLGSPWLPHGQLKKGWQSSEVPHVSPCGPREQNRDPQEEARGTLSSNQSHEKME